MFPSKTYIDRRDRLKKTLKSGLIFFPGNGESPMNYADNWYPFMQDSSFLYFTGINGIPNLYLLIDIDNNREILFGNDATPEEMVWTGAAEPMADLAAKSGIIKVKSAKELEAYVKQQRQQGQKIHYLPPYRADLRVQLAELVGKQPAEIAASSSVELVQAIVAQREIKSDEELVEIEKAVNTTVAMHTHAIKNTRPGRTELEIAGELQSIAIGGGGNIAFPIILTKNGQYLHNHATQDMLATGDLVLCDCGAENAMGYTGDMTRTFPAGKRFSALQRNVYDIVLDAHNSAVAGLRPGVQYKDLHLLAAKKLVEGLTDMGMMKGNADDAVAAGAHTLFFQCVLGHMMGLDIHDMENLGEQYVGYTPELKKSTEFGLKSLRLGKVLKEGFVVTVEPGLYFNPFLIDAWRAEGKYKDFVNYDAVEKMKAFGGVRVEEDFAITASGSRLLGKPLAKTADAIEALKYS